MQISLEDVSAAIGWPIGHVYFVDEDDANLLLPTDIWEFENPERYAAFREETNTTTFRAGDGLPGRVLASRQPSWLAVAADAADPRMQAAREAGLRAGFAFPVMAGTEVAAVVEFFSDVDREPDDELLAVMASVGTQLGRAVERLRSEQQRFQTVVDNMPAMVLLRDLEGKFILINRQYEAAYGVTNDQVRGKTLPEVDALTPGGINPEISAAHDREVIEHNRTIEHELTVRLGDGDHVFASVKFPINDHAGRIVAVGGIELDITERKEHEAELAELVRTVEQARDQAMAATETKSQFLANASHELRTPLNAIMGFTSLVKRHTAGALDQRDAENIDKILVSAENLLALINDLLDLSRIEAGRQEVDPIEFDVYPVVAECVHTIEPLVGSDVELVTKGDRGLSMYTDRDKLRQILINLLSNAVKFTDEGTVTASMEVRGSNIVLEVIDTGIGIPPEAIERVFDEFRQQVTKGRDVQRGTGLGLTISRQLARLLGGDITVTSVVGAGSTFTVSIPARYEPSQASAA
jgi:PAS domain S-box-containing protein